MKSIICFLSLFLMLIVLDVSTVNAEWRSLGSINKITTAAINLNCSHRLKNPLRTSVAVISTSDPKFQLSKTLTFDVQNPLISALYSPFGFLRDQPYALDAIALRGELTVNLINGKTTRSFVVHIVFKSGKNVLVNVVTIPRPEDYELEQNCA